jgi:PAS domain S-box
MTEQRRRRRRTERFVEKSGDLVAIVDRTGSITSTSGSSDRVVGYDPDELVDETLFDYIYPGDRKDVMERLFAGIEDPESEFHADRRIAPSDGEWRQMELRCRNMLTDDGINGMLLYHRD